MPLDSHIDAYLRRLSPAPAPTVLCLRTVGENVNRP
jgi:hypothetical protein